MAVLTEPAQVVDKISLTRNSSQTVGANAVIDFLTVQYTTDGLELGSFSGAGCIGVLRDMTLAVKCHARMNFGAAETETPRLVQHRGGSDIYVILGPNYLGGLLLSADADLVADIECQAGDTIRLELVHGGVGNTTVFAPSAASPILLQGHSI